MPKKDWTEEERKAFAERMKAGRKKAAPVKSEPVQEAPVETKEEMISISKDQFEQLLARLEKVESAKTESSTMDKTTAQIDMSGRITGVNTPHPLDPKFYTDPRERLYDLPELARYAFKQNYELDFSVEVMNYETKFGTSFSVPKFKLKLKKLILDDDTGEPIIVEHDGRKFKQGYLMKVGIFFIDPNDAIKTAVDMGIEVTDANSYDFLESMRFQQYKKWILECMKPPKPEENRSVKQAVIGGSVYQVEEWSEPA